MVTSNAWDGNRKNCRGWEECCLHEELDKTARRYPDREALTDGEESLTYGQLRQETLRLAKRLREKGLAAGDLAVVQVPNCIFFVKLFYAMSRVGAVPILMLPTHREMELTGVIQKAEANYYIAAADRMGVSYQQLAEDVIARVDWPVTLISEEELLANVGGEGENPLGLKAQRSGGENSPGADEQNGAAGPASDDLAVLLLSGGTTGVPKLIPRTHADYIYNAKMMAKRCGWDENTVYMAALPMAHNFPLAAPGILGVMLCGGKVAVAESPAPMDLYDMIEEQGVTSTALVPSLFKMFTQLRKTDTVTDLSSLQQMLVGGGMLYPAEAEEFMGLFGEKLIQVFGMAEGLICTTKPGDPPQVMAGCQGTPCSPYDQLKIVDEDDNQVAPGKEGELLTRGPYTIRFYYRLSEAQSASFTSDGWYRTGDRARIDDDGNLHITGRIREMINRGGEKIIPAVLEEILTAENVAGQLAVIGVPDEILGSKICFCYTDEKEVTLKQARDVLTKNGVAGYRLPDTVMRAKVWPLTAMGKTDKGALLSMYLEGIEAEAGRKRG